MRSRARVVALTTGALMLLGGAVAVAVPVPSPDPCAALFSSESTANLQAYDACRFDRIEKAIPGNQTVTATMTQPPVTSTVTVTPPPTTSTVTSTVTPTVTPTSTASSSTAPPTSAPPTTTPGTIGVAGWWSAPLTSVQLGNMGKTSSSGTATGNELRKQWDYWDNDGGSVASVAAEGLPAAPWGGDKVVKWHKPLNDSNVYQKLNRTFTPQNWPQGSYPAPNTTSPADVSGRYSVYRYIRSADVKLNPPHGWLVLMSFKENYVDSSGGFHQDGTGSKLGCNNFSGTVRCAMTSKKDFPLTNYTDRWVKWEYRLYQGAKDTTGHGGRAELYADNVLVDTQFEGEDGAHMGSAAFVPLSQTRAFVYTVGQYTSNQTTNGVPDYVNTQMTSYVGPAWIQPL